MAKAIELVMHAAEPAFVIDEKQEVVAVNQACVALLGYSAEEATGLTCAEFVRATLPNGDRLCRRDCAPVQRFRHGEPFHSTCAIQPKGTGRVAASLTSVAIPPSSEDKGAPPLAIVFLHQPTAVAPAGDYRLRINTLGRFNADVGDRSLPIEQWPRKQAIQLLKLLTFNVGRPVHRERLMDQLWPDAAPEAAWGSLKVTVHSLRQRLRESGMLEDTIQTQEDSYVLFASRVVIDAHLFEAAVMSGRRADRSGDKAAALGFYKEACDLYHGDYMEEDLYADWCAEERERLLDLYLEAINACAEIHYAQADYASAAQECHTALVREPCREIAHRLLIQSLIALNRPERARQQFERCRAILDRELGAEPAEETYAVLASLGTSFAQAGT